MKSQLQKIQYIALFLVALVLSMPFNAANAYASLQITKNSGATGVDGFVNASGDLWTLEVLASIAGETIAPSQLKMNNFPFTQCTQAPGGAAACTYTVDFRTTSLPQVSVPINVQLFRQDGSVSDTQSTSLSFDGSPPGISNVAIAQDGANVRARFTIKDEPQSCAGLNKIAFFEGTALLQSFEGADLPQGCQAATFEKTFPFTAQTSGTKTLTIKVADRLGHERSTPAQFFYDAAGPSIHISTFAIGSFRNFVPQGQATAEFSVNVIEERTVLAAELSIPQLSVNGVRTSCTKTDPSKHNFTCIWPVQSLELGQPFSVTITARDGGNNTDTQTLSSGFATDVTRPTADAFGTERQFSGSHFTTRDNATIVARFTETESGMSAARVAADLSDLNPRYSRRAPSNDCVNRGTQWECFWRRLSVSPGSDLTRTVFLVRAEDSVGNAADSLPSADIEIDIIPPNITSIAVTPIGQQEDREVAQSGDQLEVRFEVAEENGLFEPEVDLSAIVQDGEVTQAQCIPKAQSDGEYECNLLTPRIRSGHATYPITIGVRDTAGNRAEKTFSVEIFGTADETSPDFWRQGKVVCSPKGLDVNVVKLAPQRVFCSVELKTGARNVELLSARVVDCPDPGGVVEKISMINNFRGSTSPGIIFEFRQFEAQSQNFSTQCRLRLQSKRGTQVIQQAEDEEVNVTLPFFATKFDDALSTIEDRIDDAKDDVENGLWKTIGTINKVLGVIRGICRLTPVVILIIVAWQILTGTTDALRTNPVGTAVATKVCLTKTAETVKGMKFFEYANVLCAGVASCNPNAFAPTNPFLKAYIGWQKSVLEFYNKWTFRGSAFMPAQSLNDNLVLSAVGLCPSGIIYNLDKYRQIQCRYIYCLENEVKNGVATIESCRELKDYQECKYVYGELFQWVPFVGVIDTILSTVKSVLTDPVGLIISIAKPIVQSFCGGLCIGSGTASVACDSVTFVFMLIEAVNAIIASFDQITVEIKGNYCDQVL